MQVKLDGQGFSDIQGRRAVPYGRKIKLDLDGLRNTGIDRFGSLPDKDRNALGRNGRDARSHGHTDGAVRGNTFAVNRIPVGIKGDLLNAIARTNENRLRIAVNRRCQTGFSRSGQHGSKQNAGDNLYQQAGNGKIAAPVSGFVSERKNTQGQNPGLAKWLLLS